MTVQVPSHVRIGTQTWGLGQYDGLGTVRDDPDYYGRGLSLTDDRYLGSGTFKESGIEFSRYSQKRKIEWPHKGFVWAYPIRVTNDVVHIFFSQSVVQAGGLSDNIATIKDAGVLWWHSKTPGGEPLTRPNGKKLVQYMSRVEQFLYSMYQRYSLKDPINSKGDVNVTGNIINGVEYGIVIPIINKTYYINFAGVDSAVAEQCSSRWGNTENPNPRAPRADELVNFPATDIGGRSTLAFISSTQTAWVDYDTYIRNVT